MISNQLYFQGRDGVLQQTIGKRDISRFLYEFHDGFYGGHFAGQITVEKILQAGYYWMPMIIVGVVMCVKPMHKGLL